MNEFDAYCRYCEMVVRGKTTAINALESGNYLYIGECLICCYEIRKIVPKNKITNSIPGYQKTPPEWCDDCVSPPGSPCPICGCTHNC
jgi:hypothetical protein